MDTDKARLAAIEAEEALAIFQSAARAAQRAKMALIPGAPRLTLPAGHTIASYVDETSRELTAAAVAYSTAEYRFDKALGLARMRNTG